MPKIRGLISKASHKVGHFDDQPAVLEFVNSKELRPLAPLGTSCPDHFLRTKIRPLVIEFDPAKPDVDAVIARLPRTSPPTAPTTRPITTAASIRTRLPCATRTRWSI